MATDGDDTVVVMVVEAMVIVMVLVVTSRSLIPDALVPAVRALEVIVKVLISVLQNN